MSHANRKLLYICRIPMRWGDMDAYYHINNVQFFRYLEQARVECLDHLNPIEARDPALAIMVVHVSCDFRLQMEYPGTVELKVYAGSAGRSSFGLHYEVRIEGDDAIRAEGQDRIVWVDTRINKSTPLPDAFRAHFSTD